MESALAAGETAATTTSSSSSSSTPAPAITTATTTHDEDGRHSTVPKPAASVPHPFSPELTMKGTRFHEDCHQDPDITTSPRLRSSRLYKGKGKEAVALPREVKKPLRLLDLPVDVLKEIIKEVTHTNDLIALTLCHSALHSLAIPHLYSRFDIVWPDNPAHGEQRSGVDALTYGLATLVMAVEVFGEAPNQQRSRYAVGTGSGSGRATDMAVRRRRGNHYAQFTRKFSLGNGPAEWVQEYQIAKEGGKMLGTLVALAVARMRSLETFIWDMPTGVLRDVWLALSSLGDRGDEFPCRLEKLWVRWHDNSPPETADTIPPPPPPMIISALQPTPLQPGGGYIGNSGLTPQIHPVALDRVEHPTFSVLPPLKSLSVLDIDELAYIDEMAVLIGRSLDKLRELRVGIARHAKTRDWVAVWQGDHVQQVDTEYPTAGSLTIGEKRLGGVLGTLTGFVCDMRKPKIVLRDRTKRRSLSRPSPAPRVPEREPEIPDVLSTPTVIETENSAANDLGAPEGITSLRIARPDMPSEELPNEARTELASISIFGGDGLVSSVPDTVFDSDPLIETSQRVSPEPSIFAPPEPLQTNDHQTLESLDLPEPEVTYLDNVLQLESLELERVPLSVPVLQKAIDWTRLTSLTLLHCPNHEQLWKTLRRTFAPRPRSPVYPQPRRTPSSTPKKASRASYAAAHDFDTEYPLKLKKIHTNNVSPSLVNFLKETLAPNTLEVLFLQETRSYSSTVTIDTIFRGPLKRHRGSLKKLLIDSSEKSLDGQQVNSMRWKKWLLKREALSFMCSGKMPCLRELGMAIDYRDWHFFLQHLPSIPHLRSLYLPFLADHVHGVNVVPRELALQIVDIVALRPEVELCYLGIASKCFEILENKRSTSLLPSGLDGNTGRPDSRLTGMDGDEEEVDEDEDEVDAEEEDEEGTESEDDDDGEEDGEEQSEDGDSEEEEDDDEETSYSNDGRARLRLREILFYDDKVAVFKARHGRL